MAATNGKLIFLLIALGMLSLLPAQAANPVVTPSIDEAAGWVSHAGTVSASDLHVYVRVPGAPDHQIRCTTHGAQTPSRVAIQIWQNYGTGDGRLAPPPANCALGHPVATHISPEAQGNIVCVWRLAQPLGGGQFSTLDWMTAPDNDDGIAAADVPAVDPRSSWDHLHLSAGRAPNGAPPIGLSDVNVLRVRVRCPQTHADGGWSAWSPWAAVTAGNVGLFPYWRATAMPESAWLREPTGTVTPPGGVSLVFMALHEGDPAQDVPLGAFTTAGWNPGATAPEARRVAAVLINESGSGRVRPRRRIPRRRHMRRRDARRSAPRP